MSFFRHIKDYCMRLFGVHIDSSQYIAKQDQPQAHIVFSFLLAGVCTWSPHILLYALFSCPLTSVFGFVGFGSALIGIWIMRSGKNYQAAGLWLNYGSATALFLITFTTGGTLSPAFPWQITMLVAIYLQLGKRHGLILLFYLLGLFGVSLVYEFRPSPNFYELPFTFESKAFKIFFISNLAFIVIFTAFIIRIFINQIESKTIELNAANSALKLLSITDGLTGLENRRSFDGALVSEWKRNQREKQAFSIIMCDVDFFKKFNDTYGHQMGDDCLVSVGRAISECLQRPGDRAFRYGGEEFVILLPNTNPEGALVVAEFVRMAVENKKIPHETSDVKPCVTLTIGVHSIVPQPGLSPIDFVSFADKALYRAKERGRNKTVLFNEHQML